MDSRALTRLRIAFLLLGAALLAPLALLARSMDARLEAQRRLRHEIVAERIFDEMERELTLLLQGESSRPSEAYAASSTRVENWAPFVVGYFTRDAGGARIVAESQLPRERVERLSVALARLPPIAADDLQPPAAKTEPTRDDLADAAKYDDAKSKPEPKRRAVLRAPEAILKELSRGADQREQVQRNTEPLKRKEARKQDDPLSSTESW